MNESSDEPPLSDRIRSWARTKAYASNFNPFGADDQDRPALPVTNPPPQSHPRQDRPSLTAAAAKDGSDGIYKENTGDNVADARSPTLPPPAPPPVAEEGDGEASSSIDPQAKPSVGSRFLRDTKRIIFSSWINWLLLFVPVGVALGALGRAKSDNPPVSPTVVFAINAVAIIPLAALLSFATESVASKMGDTIGALLNVTFGNAVELIIFIALVAKEIRVVQASLLGSILANLLLILGMCFLFGGLRFREQLYNSAVSQMSACLLSLSVMSLLLPTAFHASFNNLSTADRVVVKVSRGTSVILLLVYVLYLLFQLKSHAYMYASTPQHKIDEESHPGILADMLNSSSSSDSSSSESDSDSDASSGSHKTAKRIRRALRRKRRKSSASSKDTPSAPSFVRTPSSHTTQFVDGAPLESPPPISPNPSYGLEAVVSGDEADDDGEARTDNRSHHDAGVRSRDFETEKAGSVSLSRSSSQKCKKRKKRSKKRKHSHKADRPKDDANEKTEVKSSKAEPVVHVDRTPAAPRVDFVADVEEGAAQNSSKRPFNFRELSAVRPPLPKLLSSTVFSSRQPPPSQTFPAPGASAGQSRSNTGLRRTASLPDRLNGTYAAPQVPVSAQPLPHLVPVQVEDAKDDETESTHLSKTSAILLLLVSTGLVAVCADFLVDSIDYLVDNTGVSQAFIGLIVLPIVGNAAEHVTAVTVASKNKMDLAINVALGSSIQIALFVTPVIVLLGWCIGVDMSLYFSLFETVSLFVSAFIVNYLMIDGRSNYLEGALLIAAYVIIAVLAYFYPACANVSAATGAADGSGSC